MNTPAAFNSPTQRNKIKNHIYELDPYSSAAAFALVFNPMCETDRYEDKKHQPYIGSGMNVTTYHWQTYLHQQLFYLLVRLGVRPT